MKKQVSNYDVLATVLFQGDDALQQQFVAFAQKNADGNGVLNSDAVNKMADFICHSQGLRGEVRKPVLVRALRESFRVKVA